MGRLGTELDLARNECIHTLFEFQAERTPDAVALVWDGGQLTYGCLNERADHLAHRLVSMGVKPGELVGVCIERSPEVIVGMLGILKAGAAYLPFSSSYPRDRLTFMLQDTDCRVVLVSGAVPALLRSRLDGAVIDINETQAPNSTSESYPTPASCSEDLAYVMYTSGSTGQPRGVQIPHRGVVRLVRGQKYAEFGPGLRTLQISAVSFDAATFEIWAPLLNGGSCVIGPAYLPGFDDLERLIRDQQVNCLFLTTGLFNQIVTSRPSALAGVGQVLTGGDVMSAAHALKFLEALPSTRLTNAYGPTECTTFACLYEMPSDPRSIPGRVPIGKPMGRTSCYVLGSDLSPVPAGRYGELCIGGDGVACGYLNQPELTAQKFVADPFSSVPGARMYRTGDECRWLPDGNLEFRGRMDDQMKVREFRIEPGEVEAALMRHPGVAASAVVTREGPGGTRSLAAFLVSKNLLPPPAEAVRAEAEKWLPEYMLPSSFHFVRELPLTPNGKVDRTELARLAKTAMEGAVQNGRPLTVCEQQLAEIWSSVLERPGIGIHENFFDLGGNSVMAMRLVSEMGRKFDRRVPVAALFQAPTIAQMAAWFEGSNENGTSPPRLRGETDGAVLIHVPGYHLWGFLPKRVAQRVGSIRRYYDGLQYPGLNGEELPTSIEEFAAHLIPQIQTVAPDEPLCLSGHSFGGMVAYELARQLREQGRRIELLLLLDSYVPAIYGRRSAAMIILDTVRYVFDPQFAAYRLQYVSHRGRRAIGKAVRIVSGRQTARRLVELAKPEQSKRIDDAVVKACFAYQPLPYEGKAVLFRPKQPFRFGLRTAPDALNGWGNFIQGGLEVVHVPGSHFTMVQEPAVSTLADRVYECLLKHSSPPLGLQ